MDPFQGVENVGGVTFDGRHVWLAGGDKLLSVDPDSGKTGRSIDVAAHAGTAFDGKHLYQIAENRIQKIDPQTGKVLATIPAPGNGGDSGLAWAEGALWVGQYRERKIHQVDPETGKILRTIQSDRFVTGVSLGGGRALARHVGRRRERHPAHRSRDWSGAGRAADARRRWNFRTGVERQRPLFLRRRPLGQGARRAPAGSPDPVLMNS